MFLLSSWKDAAWELDLIRRLSSSGNEFLNKLFQGITFLGDEMFFILIAAVLYWCFDKKYAFRYMFAYMSGAVIVGIIKNFVARPRPFKQGINSIGTETHGHSFPSGHSQSIAAQGTMLSLKFGNRKRWWVYFAAALIVLLVMFSRMYLAQHFLTDVLVGACIGVASAFLFGYLFDLMGNREEYFSLTAIPVFVIMMIVQGKGEYGAIKDLYVASAGFIAVAIGYLIEKKFIKYDVRKSRWWVQIIKFTAALAVALAIKEGLKAAFPKENVIFDFIRYFLMALWASCGALAVFKYTEIFWNKKFPPKGSNQEKHGDEAAAETNGEV